MSSTNTIQATRETERKYEAAEQMRLPEPEPAARPSGPTRHPMIQQLDAVYFDTADLRLARAGITLRRREGGCDPGWHLKLPLGRRQPRRAAGAARPSPPQATAAELLR